MKATLGHRAARKPLLSAATLPGILRLALITALALLPGRAQSGDRPEAALLWVAEENGVLELSELEGRVLFEIPDLPGIAAVALDAGRHRLWVLAGGSLHAYDQAGVESLAIATATADWHPQPLPHLAVNPMDGSIVLAQGRGIAAYDASGSLLWSAQLAGDTRGLAFAAGQPLLWVAEDQGAVEVDAASGAIVGGLAAGGAAPVIDLAATPDGELWILQVDRVQRLSPNGAVRSRRAIAVGRQVASDGGGGVWVATDREVLHLDDAAQVLARVEPFFGAGRIVDLRPHPEDGSLWIANEVDLAKVSPAGAVVRRWRFEPAVRLLALAIDAGIGTPISGGIGTGTTRHPRRGSEVTAGAEGRGPAIPGSRAAAGTAVAVGPAPRPFMSGSAVDRSTSGRAVTDSAPLAGQLGAGPLATVSATAPYQAAPAAAGDPAGDFVIGWQRQSATGGWDVYARVYTQSSSGPVGSAEFAVTTGTAGCRRAPAVAADALGNFVVVWQSDESGNLQVYGRLFDSSGNPRSANPFQVNATAGGTQQKPAVAMTPDGRFLVLWETLGVAGEDAASWGVEGRAFLANGTPASGDFAVNTTTAGAQLAPAVAWLPSPGRFEAVWQSEGQDGSTAAAGSSGIWGRSFDASGNATSSEVQIDVPNGAAHGHPRVASDPSGNFTVAWESATAAGSAVAVRRFFANGTASAQLLADPANVGSQRNPVVTAAPTGDLVVAWDALRPDGSGAALYAQLYDSSTQPSGTRLQLDLPTPAGDQSFAALTPAVGRGPWAAWQSATTTGEVVAAQQLLLPGLNFYTLTPCRLLDTRNPNGPLAGPALTSGQVRIFPLLASPCLPANVNPKYLSVNYTVVTPGGTGSLVVYPGDGPTPGTSSINFNAGDVRANNGILLLSLDGQGNAAVLPSLGAGNQVHFIIDVNGYLQ
jgi:hypothetical protein